MADQKKLETLKEKYEYTTKFAKEMKDVKPSNNDLLMFYGYFKRVQVLNGDCKEPQAPGTLSFDFEAKENKAYEKVKEVSLDDAMQGYIDAVVKYRKEHAADSPETKKLLEAVGEEQ